MTEIYFIRHCEAMGNVNRTLQGVINTEISEMGEKQLKYLSERFANIKIDAVYSSPLKRTLKTAHAVADCKGLEVITDDEVIEINCGIYEGMPFEEFFADPERVDIWNNRPQDFEPEGGESYREVYERIWRAVKRLADENKGKTIAVVTHGGVLRNLFCRLKLGSIERIREMPYCDNTAVSLVRFEEQNPQIVFYNDCSHLPPECIPEGSRVPDVGEEQK